MKELLKTAIAAIFFLAFSIWILSLNYNLRDKETMDEAGLNKLEFREFIDKAEDNDTKSFERLETHFVFYVKDSVDMVVFFKKYAHLNNPKVNDVLAFHIRKIAFEHRVYLNDSELKKLLKEALFYMKKSVSKRAKQTLEKYKNLNDEQIINKWSEDIRGYDERRDINLLYRW